VTRVAAERGADRFPGKAGRGRVTEEGRGQARRITQILPNW